MTRRVALALVVLACGFVPVARAAVTAVSCADDSLGGGDWPSYGRDLTGSRNQSDEDVLGAANVADLEVAWLGSPQVAPSGQSTPVVAGRCVYVAGAGRLSAVDIVDGAVVWQQPLPFAGAAYAVAVADGRVHVNLDTGETARAASFDADSGAPLSTSEPIEFGYRVDQIASAVVWDGKQVLPTSGPDADPAARPGIAVLDALDLSTLSKHTTIPAADLDRGFAGGGIWATPVVDVDSGYAFVGTAQPYSKQREHERDNAIVKIDLRHRPDVNPTFGQVVGVYKGDVDSYVAGLNRQPACDIAGDTIEYHPSGFSVTCVQFDVDFGGSPTMFRNRQGELLVGELQKSGNFHTVRAATMAPAWKTLVSTLPPATGGNASSAANDGERVYVLANPGVVHALDVDTGAIQWATPLAIATLENHPVAVANGVVYVMVNSFHVYGLDAATGTPLWVTNAAADAGTMCSQPSGGGIAIARHTIVVNCDGSLVAYRVPST